MKPGWSFVAASAALVLTLVVAASGAMAGGGSNGAQVGKPWTGAAGIQRTTAQIMAAQRSEAAPSLKSVPLHVAKLHRQPNPQAVPSRLTKLGQALATSPKTLSVGTTFTGPTLSDSGFVPPDSMGAVGPTQFLVGVNGRIRVYSKLGVVGTLDTSLDSFFSTVITASSHAVDPRVRYDALSGRWFVTAIDTGTGGANNRVLIAVSSGSTIDVSTVWTFFQFRQDVPSPSGDANDFADFDTLGIDANALYIGANIFDSSDNFVNTTGFVVRKSSVTGGGPIVVTAFRHLLDGSFNGPYTPQGVDNADPAATEGYFIGIDGNQFSVLNIRRVSTPGATPTLSGNLVVNLPAESSPINPTVVGSTKQLDGIDDRLTSSSIRNGKLYTAEAMGVDASGNANGTPSRDAVQWYEIGNLTSTPTLSRSGELFDGSGNATSYWMPSIAVSPQGEAVLGMSSGGPAARPNGAYASMLSSENAFSAPVNYTSSTQDYNVNTVPPGPVYRWGDYSHTSVDPCDGQTFWTIQEFVNSQNSWAVQVAKILAPPPATPASTSPSAVLPGQASVDVTLTGTSTAGSGFWDPGSGTCRIQAQIDGNVTWDPLESTCRHASLSIL